jgi:nucleotidyltransferase/DNA polymerase involved in DNA repair
VRDKVSAEYKEAIQKLMQVPGVGKMIADDLWNLGICSIADLEDRDPQELYDQLCDYQGMRIDRCVLYVFRCAVHFASNRDHDPEKLKWWKWKDGSLSDDPALSPDSP